MILGYISDMHEEFMSRDYRIPECDVLVIAGDIHTSPEKAGLVLRKLANSSRETLYVMGNHEYYRHRFPDIQNSYRKQASINNVTFLEKNQVIIKGVRFLGTTLWTDLSDPIQARAAEQEIYDFEFITTKSGNLLRARDVTNEWKKCRAWLEGMLKMKHNGPTVVITHHSPSSITCGPEYKTSPVRNAFHSSMEDMIFRYHPELWIYGHDHISGWHQLEKTILMSNQAGYPNKRGEINIVETIEVLGSES